MSVQAIGWVLDNSESHLADRLVLLSIANHAKADGTGAWPSVGLIAQEAHMSSRNVQRCIRNLEKLGELHVVYQMGPYHSNLYTVVGMPSTPDKLSGGGDKLAPVPLTVLSPKPTTNQKKEESSSKSLYRHHTLLDQSAAENERAPFHLFLKAYPEERVLDEKRARQQWSLIPPGEYGAVIAGLETWKKCEQWREPRFIPEAHRFLERKQWQKKPPGKGESDGERFKREMRARHTG